MRRKAIPSRWLVTAVLVVVAIAVAAVVTFATLELGGAPSFTSLASTTSFVGAPFRFMVSTDGYRTSKVSEIGPLPPGLRLADNGNGTATISGTPRIGTQGTYRFTIGAVSGRHRSTQNFVLINADAPLITSASKVVFPIGIPYTFPVTATGYPVPSIQEVGTLPPGITFQRGPDGSAQLTGTGRASSPHPYKVTLRASNAWPSPSAVHLEVDVDPPAPPSFSLADPGYFKLGGKGYLAITAVGAPIPSLRSAGPLPPGLSFVDEGGGTALVSGTPSSLASTTLDIVATNVVSTASASVLIVVGQPPTITSPNTVSFRTGFFGRFVVTTTGYPSPLVLEKSLTGSLASWLLILDTADGTATLSGTPSFADVGSSTLTLQAVNDYGVVTQVLTITVGP